MDRVSPCTSPNVKLLNLPLFTQINSYEEKRLLHWIFPGGSPFFVTPDNTVLYINVIISDSRTGTNFILRSTISSENDFFRNPLSASSSDPVLEFIWRTSHLTAENFTEIASRMETTVLRNSRNRLRGISQHGTTPSAGGTL